MMEPVEELLALVVVVEAVACLYWCHSKKERKMINTLDVLVSHSKSFSIFLVNIQIHLPCVL